MSKDQHVIQRHIDECLEDRQEMLDWMRKARRLTPLDITEADWLRWGHLTPEDWLQVCWEAKAAAEDYEDFMLDDWEDDGWYDENDDYEDDEPYRSAPSWWSLLDFDDDWEPVDLEFGGRLYPRNDVESVRRLLGTE